MQTVQFKPYVYGSLQWWANGDCKVSLFLHQEEVTTVNLTGCGLRNLGVYAFNLALFDSQILNIEVKAYPLPFGYHHLNKHPYPVAQSLWTVNALFPLHKIEVEQHLVTLLNHPDKTLTSMAFLTLCLQTYSPVNPNFIEKNCTVIQQLFWDFCLITPANDDEQALIFLTLHTFVQLFDFLGNPLQVEARALYYQKENLLCYPETPLGCAYLILASADADNHAKAFLSHYFLTDTTLENSYAIAQALLASQQFNNFKHFIQSVNLENQEATLYQQGFKTLS